MNGLTSSPSPSSGDARGRRRAPPDANRFIRCHSGLIEDWGLLIERIPHIGGLRTYLGHEFHGIRSSFRRLPFLA